MAARAPKIHAGNLACLCCGHEIPVKESGTGTQNLSCPWCDFTGYVKPGTRAHGIVAQRLARQAKPAEETRYDRQRAIATAPAPTPAPTPAPAPAAAPKPPASWLHGL